MARVEAIVRMTGAFEILPRFEITVSSGMGTFSKSKRPQITTDTASRHGDKGFDAKAGCLVWASGVIGENLGGCEGNAGFVAIDRAGAKTKATARADDLPQRRRGRREKLARRVTALIEATNDTGAAGREGRGGYVRIFGLCKRGLLDCRRGGSRVFSAF